MNTHIVIIMYAIVANLKLMQHNDWGIVGIQYANVCIQRRPRWLYVFAFFYRRNSTSIRWSKLRIVLLFNIAGWTNIGSNTWLFRWCRETNVTNEGVGLPQSRGSSVSMTWHITRWSPDDSTEIWMNCRSQVGVRASDFWLKWPPKTWHLFTLSVIAGADNQ